MGIHDQRTTVVNFLSVLGENHEANKCYTTTRYSGSVVKANCHGFVVFFKSENLRIFVSTAYVGGMVGLTLYWSLVVAWILTTVKIGRTWTLEERSFATLTSTLKGFSERCYGYGSIR